MPSPITHEQLTQEEFENILDAMETHYVATIKGESAEPLPRFLSSYSIATFEKNDSLNNFEDEVKKETNSDLSKWTDKGEPDTTHLTTKKLNNEISDEEWDKEIEERKNADIEVATQTISKAYDKIKERGNANPDEREALLLFVNVVSEGIKKVVNIVVEFLENLAKKIWEWLKAAYEYIKETFVLAYKTILNIFG
ncbi:hypothetical protein [Nostoc sp.]|uniref:hypothetical protein n=1 Tax=Nostoc sp. TaxID=1180 RepID=UPI002FF8B40D